MLAQQVAGGDLRAAELRHQQLRLRAFPGAGRAEHQHWAGKKIARVRQWMRHKRVQGSASRIQKAACLLGPGPWSLALLPAAASLDASRLRREAVVVAHDELRFDLIDRVHRDADNDQQRRSAEVEVEAETVGKHGWELIEERTDEPEMVEMDSAEQEHRENRNGDKINRANQRNARQDIVDEVRRALAGACL